MEGTAATNVPVTALELFSKQPPSGQPRSPAIKLKVITAARELSVELNVEQIHYLLQSTRVLKELPTPAIELRELYAEYRAIWAEILPRLSVEVPQGIPESQVDDARLRLLLGPQDFIEFKEGQGGFDAQLNALAKAIRIRHEWTHEQKDTVNMLIIGYNEEESSSKPHIAVTGAQFFSQEFRRYLSGRRGVNESGTSLDIGVAWTLNNETTQTHFRYARSALRMMNKAITRLRVSAIPEFSVLNDQAAVVYWRLALTGESQVKQISLRNLSDNLSKETADWPSIPERAFGIYEREPVPDKELKPWGMYRGNDFSERGVRPMTDFMLQGVCKIWMWYHERPYPLCGSGWLIDDRTVITAAHNIYYVGHYGPEHVKRVRVATGYDGSKVPANTADGHQIRYAKSVAVHQGYYARDAKDHSVVWQKHDFACIRLEAPFESVNPFRYKETPIREMNVTIRVVGYPDDLPANDKEKQGSIMYSASQKMEGRLGTLQDRLSYKLDTSHGTSGGPIFRVEGDRLEVIGVHTTGDRLAGLNMGTLLGRYGNEPDLFRQIMDTMEEDESDRRLSVEDITLIDRELFGKQIRIPW
ncbi:MAG: hypothetical protein Q9162_003646 [Coniocarpon cinnabarinum]